jgi:hypothetical protein
MDKAMKILTALAMTMLVTLLLTNITYSAGITVTVTMQICQSDNSKTNRSGRNVIKDTVPVHRNTAAVELPHKNLKTDDTLVGSAQNRNNVISYVSNCSLISTANSLNVAFGNSAGLWFKAPNTLISESDHIATLTVGNK